MLLSLKRMTPLVWAHRVSLRSIQEYGFSVLVHTAHLTRHPIEDEFAPHSAIPRGREGGMFMSHSVAPKKSWFLLNLLYTSDTH